MSGVELWIRAASALALIALVLLGLKFVLHKLQRLTWPPGGRRTLEIVETLPLANGTGLHLVRIGRRYVAVGGGSAQLRCICEVAVEDVATPQRDDEANRRLEQSDR